MGHRVLTFGDMHIPFMRDGYVDFLKDIYKKYKCDTVVCTGDVFDLHRISRHLPHPDAMGSKEEYLKGMDKAKLLYKAFPNAYVCIGNHDARLYRQAAEQSIPEAMLKTYTEWTGSPKGWKWALRHIVDGVLYTHGNLSGETAHIMIAKTSRMSAVSGHIHTNGGVNYLAGPNDLIFAMCPGCGMDSTTYAAQYAELCNKKPVVGCGVVLNGKQAIFIPMDLGNKVRRIK